MVVLEAASEVVRTVDAPPVTGTGGLPPTPDLSHGYLPARSASLSATGAPLDYLPIQMTCKGSKCSGSISVAGPPLLGFIDPSGKEHDALDYTAYYAQPIGIQMIDPASSVAQGSTLVEEIYWQLMFSVGVPANTPFEFDQTLTSGITNTDQTTFSYTVGAKVGDKLGDLTGELSASLTKSFQHTIAITNQIQNTYKFQWPQRPRNMTVGVYQLMQEFSVQPAGNFTAYIGQENNIWGQCGGLIGLCIKFASDATFPYPTPTYLQVATTPPHVPAGGRPGPTLGSEEIQRLVEKSISFS